MAPVLVGKIEGVEGTRRIAAQEAEDAVRRQRRMEMREACAQHSIAVGNAMEKQSKVEKKANKKLNSSKTSPEQTAQPQVCNKRTRQRNHD